MTPAVIQTDYPYTLYLAERDASQEPPPLLSETKFNESLAAYMNLTRQIGEAYRKQEAYRAGELREKRRPLKVALLIGG